ncbi:MAG TPA: exopolysaccharide biosynthesis polyprenyl glycosylphosphotransferase [Polyangiaceae bacterium]|jgi:putative colanic acid biosynthesis UDP-glucose lipid carrier transferase|nr:exopolysaccharide biosynthesis polyprenyl glycosylphosphotransferase [Polyangiaceae bacterium]
MQAPDDPLRIRPTPSTTVDEMEDIPPPASSHFPRAARLTALRPSSVPPPPEAELMLALGDTLLAAAAADGEICNRELRVVRRILRRLHGDDDLPLWLEAHIEAFDPKGFSLAKTLDVLRELPPEQRRHVVELVREVCDANNAFDIEEERYLMSLGVALSLCHEDIADLVVHASRTVDGFAKRVFDVLVAGSFLACAWPLLLMIGTAVKVESTGPALFKQRRYGKHGEEILVWKFRTMRATEDGDAFRQATRGDPRITRLGGFLRRTSLDELPQFFNVLTGEMSVVGPRPHAVAHNVEYRTRILEYMLRHKVKPGITGWAQVNGFRGETDTLDKMIQRVVHDLEYIRRHTLWLDVEIVVRTALGQKARSNAY